MTNCKILQCSTISQKTVMRGGRRQKDVQRSLSRAAEGRSKEL
ncbi:MAG: hypothetical protein V7K43_23515 [Nostoc sp.]